MSEYVDPCDPGWVDAMLGVIERAKGIGVTAHPWDGKLVVSKVNVLCTARVGVADGKAVLNFGWDSPKSRFWPCSVEDLEKHYRLL